MVMFCDFLILVLSTVFLVVHAGVIPLEEVNAIILPYNRIVFWAILGFFALKYLVHTIQTVRDIRYISTSGGQPTTSDYLLLGVYPVCDLLRMGVSLGIISAVIHNIVRDYSAFDPLLTHIILLVIIIIGIFVDFFTKDSEKLLVHLIPTGVILAAALVVSKDMFVRGLQLF